MDRDLLHQAAEKWINLTDYRYIFTYGYKKKLHTLTLCFTSSDFAHLADFHYMKDVTTPQYYSRKLPQKILDESIDTAPFLQAAQFDEMVVPRLHAIIRLKDSLDNDFTLFKYNPNFYSFYTSIKADYLITSHSTNTDFVFIIHSQEDSASMEYTCCSIFEQGQRDYEEGQRERTLLKKERIYIPENHSDILFDRLSSPTSKD